MTRGGSRKGAGAKPKPLELKAKRATFALTPDTLAAIKAKADAHGVSQARLLTLAVEAYPAQATT